jgi:hypothetical protein
MGILRRFLFEADSRRWLEILRIGLGIQVILFTWSLRLDWESLLGRERGGQVNRLLIEAILSGQSSLTPRLGWLFSVGQFTGLSDRAILWIIWSALLGSGCLLLAGLWPRVVSIGTWLLYLATVKSAVLLAYGVDNFTVTGLFYLMIASVSRNWWPIGTPSNISIRPQERLGFHRRILQLHLCLVYFFAGFSKSFGSGWWNGDNIWGALTRPPFNVLRPELLLHFEPLFFLLGTFVCLLETGYPIFIWSRKTRSVWLVLIIVMHLGIGLTMGLYLFALIMITLNLSAFGAELFSGERWIFGRPPLLQRHIVARSVGE